LKLIEKLENNKALKDDYQGKKPRSMWRTGGQGLYLNGPNG